MGQSALPEVRPVGTNPDDWDSDYPAADAKPGDKYTVTIEQGESKDSPIKWVKASDAPDEDEDEEVYYDIVGNFNEWEGDRMMAGSVPGMHVTTAEVPESGILEFRFQKSPDEELVIAPARPSCRRMLEKIMGPE